MSTGCTPLPAVSVTRPLRVFAAAAPAQHSPALTNHRTSRMSRSFPASILSPAPRVAGFIGCASPFQSEPQGVHGVRALEARRGLIHERRVGHGGEPRLELPADTGARLDPLVAAPVVGCVGGGLGVAADAGAHARGELPLAAVPRDAAAGVVVLVGV